MADWLHVIRIGHDILLPSSINGGPVHFLIADTGASMSTLSLAYARQSGKVHEESDLKFRGISGKVKKTFMLDPSTLQFGNLRVPQDSYPAFDITNVSHDEGTEVSGFVGLPTLSRLTITIDYRDNLVHLQYDRKRDPWLLLR